MRQYYVSNDVLFLVVLLYWHKIFGQFCKPKDCIDLKCYGVSTAERGVYIYPNSTSLPKVLVTCQQTSDGGGWILYLHRFDGSVLFNRTWDDYKNGFGQQGGNKESWLGNEKVYQLEKTFDGGAKIRIEGFLFDGTSCVISADNFRLERESKKYKLHFGKVTSSHGSLVEDDWAYHRGVEFTTTDRSIASCRLYNGGWWHKRCHYVYLTAVYARSSNVTYLFFTMYIDHFAKAPLMAADMMFRPTKTNRPRCNNPCENDGACEYVESSNNYRCVCPKTHCGVNCEKKNTCKNDGICLYSSDKPCACDSSHTGTHCEVLVTTTTTTTPTMTTINSAMMTTTTPTTPAKQIKPKSSNLPIIIGIFSFVLLMILIGIIVSIRVQRTRLEDERRQAEEEKQRLENMPKDTENDDNVFRFLSSMM